MKRMVWGAAMAALLSGPGLAQTPQEQLINQLTAALANIQAYEARLSAMEDRLEKAEANAAPQGAVVAFDRDGGCPGGWEDFKPAISRTIIGAVASRGMNAPTKDENGQFLTARQYRRDGGTEKHALLEAEMPIHRHEFDLSDIEKEAGGSLPSIQKFPDFLINGISAQTNLTGGSGNRIGGFQLVIAEAGGSEPHNNMPPYIALHYCKKTQ